MSTDPRHWVTPVTLLTIGLAAAAPGAQEPAGDAASDRSRPEPLVARSGQPLDLLLTQSELREFVRNYESATGQNLTAPINDDDEVVVTAPGERVPMRDVSQDVWPAIAAPFWAILHPKDAWRILVPIPPKDGAKDEPPAPDPR
jgi:hypothetical protein